MSEHDSDLKRVLVESNTTDVVLGESDTYHEHLGLYGPYGELLFYFSPEDAEFFENCANELRRRRTS